MILRAQLPVMTRLGWPGVRLAFPGLRGLGQVLCSGAPCASGVPNFSEGQWYELIALTSNQPLASVQAYYSQTQSQEYGGQSYFAPKAPLTNLQIALGQWPGGIAHSAYLAYEQGNIVDAVQGGHYFQYGGAWAGTMGQLAQNNPWAVPAQQPTTQQVLAATNAMFGQYRQAMSAPVYSQNQNAAAVIAAYNAANPQAPVTVQGAAPTTSTVQSSSTTSVQAGSAGSTTTTAGTTSFFDTITNFLTGSMLGGIPNWVLMGGGAAVLLFLLQSHGRR